MPDMVVTISGWIEARPRDDERFRVWQPAMNLDLLDVEPDYDAFGCLFGVQNHAGFRPVAAGRGLPDDVSSGVRGAWELRIGDTFGTSWLSWDELEHVDWEEPAERPDARIHRYRRGRDGGWEFEGKSSWDRELAALTGVSLARAMAGDVVWPEGASWQVGDHLYRAVRMRRREAIGPDSSWQPVFAVMALLAALHGRRNVRTVAWFHR